MSLDRWRRVAWLGPPLVIAFLAIPLLFPHPAVGDNFQFWAAGHLVASGMSPYDRASWESFASYGPLPGGVAYNTVPLNLAHTSEVWLYPPQTAFLFAPFGMLPLELGISLLHLVAAVAAFAGLALAAQRAGLPYAARAFAVSLAVVAEPFVIPVRDGHPIGLLLLGAVLLADGVARRDRRWIAVGTALLTLKPQIVALFAAGVFAYLFYRRDGRSAFAMLTGAVAATLPFELLTPFPLSALAASGSERLALDLSTIPALARDLGGGAALTVALALVAVSLCGLAVIRSPSERRGIVGAASLGVLSLALVPYAHDYDLLVAVPAVFVALALTTASRTQRVMALVAVVALAVVPWVLFYWWPLAGDPGRRYLGGPLGAVPIVCALALALGSLLARLERMDVTPYQPEREVA